MKKGSFGIEVKSLKSINEPTFLSLIEGAKKYATLSLSLSIFKAAALPDLDHFYFKEGGMFFGGW